MTELLTAAQMRAIEQAAIASGEVTGLELMERAGRGVVEAVFEEWTELAEGAHRAVVLCGPGNNGGDGFVVARLLKEVGWEVEVFLYGDAQKLPSDAKANYERWVDMGEVAALGTIKRDYYHNAELIIDAFFGTGLSRPLESECLIPLRDARINNDEPNGPLIVAVDVPSGLCADSGRTIKLPDDHGLYPFAHLTVAFHGFKNGHYMARGARHCGKLVLVDIGLPSIERRWVRGKGFQPPNGSASLLSPDNRRFRRNQRGLKKIGLDTHKYSHGHALIQSGGVGKGGAARLAARGALRVGAGAVTLGCPPAALIENAAQLNAIMLRAVKGVDGVDNILEDDRINALCMGPGMGVSDESRGLVEVGLQSGRGLVLDADALTLIGHDAPLFGLLHKECVLTPHAGEFARLFPDVAEKLAAPATKGPAYSKVDATREAAKRAGCVVLFKGPDTVIADPSGRCSINGSVYERSAPWLATAGSGDVLAGFITGLLARGFAPMQAAETGAWLHTECALSFGPGLIAEDLPEELPKVFRALGI
ncbi:NAD(P)H-hydrate dehydratase [Yoonia sp. F2084L]|uniref:NAD(P)H-hydrate dehydratase n=1 Tax=Yoonia sp. F2084L TaxID=2926419 RepID=UPI001FF2EBAD|nr:NAD(P)H-hydrate dehydratase [Yoonia sp. F2084L]MCK0094192.1 NAD(P)H-hydrate dehydratase [Yoonia sp. F2084L]